MENHIPDQSVFEAMIEEVAGESVDGKAFTLAVKTPERKRCYEELKAARILIDVPIQPDDPKILGSTLRTARLGVRAKALAEENVLVRATEDWRANWEKYNDDTFGTYRVQGEHGKKDTQ